jgi:succinate dehydrogenase hydrophobic anchor subunit
VRPFVPACQTAGAIILIPGLVWVLGWKASTGAAESNAVVESVPWLVWLVVGAITALVFVVLSWHGMRVLLRDAGRRKPGPVWNPGHGRLRFWSLVGLAALVLAFSGWSVLWASRHVGGDRLVLPVYLLNFRTGGLLCLGLVALVPWLALAWLVHAECRTIRRVSGLDTPSVNHDAVLRLGRLWKHIVSCVTAFAVGVIGAMATTGVMRVVFLQAFPKQKSEFPAGYVLLYGFPFLMAVLIISVPLIIAWRAAATHVLDHVVPIPADLCLTDEWTNQRDRMTSLLRLDVSLVRSPLAVLSTVTPLVITLLAAFLPDLAVA